MQIQDSQTMFQHIENGGSIRLGMRGKLETESAAGRFFQKIGDAIASLTSSGRAAIERRNAHLDAVMARMLRQETLVNPTQNEIFSPLTPTQRNAFIMRLAVARAAREFPPESRVAARNLGLNLLRLQGLPEQGDPAETRDKALAVMSKIQTDEVVYNALHCGYARNDTQLQPMLSEVGADLRETFMSQKDRNIKENGMHPSYLMDALRGSVRSINGQKPDMANLEGKFKALIPDPKFRGFLSMMASQAGLNGALSVQLMRSDRIKDNPLTPDPDDMQDKGLMIVTPHHQYDIRVEDGQARVRLEFDALIKPDFSTVANLFQITGAPGREIANEPIGGGRYTLELVVDLKQNMEGRDIPEFTLKNASRKPIPVPPPVLIPPPEG
jgi:hypothetical protein